MEARLVAINILKAVIFDKQSLTMMINRFIESATPRERGFVKEIAYGVCRYYHRIEWYKSRLLTKPLNEKDRDLDVLLLIGFYQIEFMRTPEHAAVSETVNTVNHLKKPWARGLVNGLLRNFIRKREKFSAAAHKHVVAEFAHPYWLIKLIKDGWPEKWKQILRNNNKYPPMSLRVNLKKCSRLEYLRELAPIGITATKSQYSDAGITLGRAMNVDKLPQFDSGYISVQDCAGQLAAKLLQLTPGLRVLDACSAPGSKTTHILESQPDLNELVAIEKDPKRIEMLNENLLRLCLNATLVTADANDVNDWWDQKKFDRILLDAPCSATGVIRRHPDIKLLRQEDDIKNLAEQQLQLLTSLWPTLENEGLLLYATCSVLPQENQDLISTFLEKTEDAEVIPIQAKWGYVCSVGRQIFPGDDGMDGFYYCLLKKKSL